MEGFKWGLRAIGCALAVAMLVSCGGSGSPESAVAKEAAAPKAENYSVFTAHGFYWNPAEPGTGMFVEQQGPRAVVTLYMYDEAGRATWYMSTGVLGGTGETAFFSGRLLRYSGGQGASSATPRTPVSTDQGALKLQFRDGVVQVQLNDQAVLHLYPFFPPGTAIPPTATQPETGIYWNPAESGRGYVVQVNNGTAMVGVFHYDDAGNPTWNLVVAPLSTAQASGEFVGYKGGRTLAGPWKAAQQLPVQGKLGLSFQQPCQGKLTLPGMPAIDIRRFSFGQLPAGAECRTAQSPGQDRQSAYFHGVSLALQSPGRIEGETFQGGRVNNMFEFAYSGDGSSLSGKRLYVIVEDPDRLFDGTSTLGIDTDLQRATLRLGARTLDRLGRYQGNLRFFVCLDAACATQLDGSPMTVPYDFTTRAGLSSDPGTIHPLIFKPSDDTIVLPVTLKVPAKSGDSIEVLGTKAQIQLPGRVQLQGGSWRIPVSDQPQEVQVLATVSRKTVGDWPPYLKAKVTTAAQGQGLGGTTQASLRLDLPGRFAEEFNTNLGPLTPLPGVQPWSTYQGNAGHTGYVPAVLDPQKFSRRFVRDQVGGSPVVAEGGRACRSLRDTQGSAVECLSEQTGEPLWRRATGPYVTTPALYAGRVLVTSGGSEYGDNDFLHIIDAANGALVVRHRMQTRGAETPTVVGNTAWLSGHGYASSIDLYTGSMGSIAGLPEGDMFAVTAAGGRLYFMRKGKLFIVTDPAATQHGAIVDPSSIDRLVARSLRGAVAVDGNAAYAVQTGSYSSHLTKFDLATNTAAWSVRGNQVGHPTQGGDYVSNPVPAGDTVYILTTWTLEARSAADGSLRWWIASGKNTVDDASLVVVGKHVFFSTPDGTRAVDAQTGQQVWSDPVRGKLSVSENGILYISGYDKLVAVNLR